MTLIHGGILDYKLYINSSLVFTEQKNFEITITAIRQNTL